MKINERPSKLVCSIYVEVQNTLPSIRGWRQDPEMRPNMEWLCRLCGSVTKELDTLLAGSPLRNMPRTQCYWPLSHNYPSQCEGFVLKWYGLEGGGCVVQDFWGLSC